MLKQLYSTMKIESFSCNLSNLFLPSPPPRLFLSLPDLCSAEAKIAWYHSVTAMVEEIYDCFIPYSTHSYLIVTY